MNDGRTQPLGKRWRLWLATLAAGWLAVATWMSLPYFGFTRGVTDANCARVVPGLTRAEVEDILGPPNPLPDLARKGEAFWDGSQWLGYRRVRFDVGYDADGRVAWTRSRSFWFWSRSLAQIFGGSDGLTTSVLHLVGVAIAGIGVASIAIWSLRSRSRSILRSFLFRQNHRDSDKATK